MRVRFSKLALAELDAVLNNIHADNPGAAVRFNERASRVIERIGQFRDGAQEVAERPGVHRVPGRSGGATTVSDVSGLSEQAAKILSRFPGPVTLYPSKLKWSLYFVVTAFVAAPAAWTLLDSGYGRDRWEIIEALFLFILCGFLAVIAGTAFVTSSISLTLDATDFEYRTIWNRRRYSWRDVDHFTRGIVLTYEWTIDVVDFDDATRTKGFSNTLNRAVTGHDRRLWETFGLNGAQLAHLMTAWRERALAQSP